MQINIAVDLLYRFQAPADVLLQIEAAHQADQEVVSEKLEVPNPGELTRIASDDGVGNRIWFRAEGDVRCRYEAQVEIQRANIELQTLDATSLNRLPADATRYLMPSRFCQSDIFQAVAAAEFGGVSGDKCVAAIRDWIGQSISYVPGSSDARTTALDTYMQREGICRDFAHVLITLARASDIPARFASVYAPGVTPQDFHAVAEVYLAGEWHLVDATGMASPADIVRIGVGPDAANVAFLTAFGTTELLEQTVDVKVG